MDSNKLTNKDIKLIRSLKDKKFREELGLFVVEGEKMVSEALASEMHVERIYRSSEIGEDAMGKISHLSTPSPVLALVRIAPNIVAENIDKSLYLGLDAVRDPGNFGTILRIADWFGVRTVFCSQDCVDAYNPKVVMASMGSIFRVKVFYCDLKELCSRFQDLKMPIYGTFLDGENIYQKELKSTGLVLMGNESRGISTELVPYVDSRLFIPSFENSKAESLNVAVASAICLSEFQRRG